MTFTRTQIADVIMIDPVVHGDERGYFVETFRQDKLESFLGFKVNFCQDNESKSIQGVLRGLHYQLPPHAQTKLVRVIEGPVFNDQVGISTYVKDLTKAILDIIPQFNNDKPERRIERSLTNEAKKYAKQYN